MNNKLLKFIVYALVTSALITMLTAAALMEMKRSACDGVISSIPEFTSYSGPCAADGNAFAAMSIVIFGVAIILVSLNVWVIKRLKL